MKFWSIETERWIELFIHSIFDIKVKEVDISLVVNDFKSKKITKHLIKNYLKENQEIIELKKEQIIAFVSSKILKYLSQTLLVYTKFLHSKNN